MIEIKENEKPLYEMANFSREDSGLPLDIWIDSAGKTRNTPHKDSPRVKIGKGKNLVPVLVNPTKLLKRNTKLNSTDINVVLKFINKNKDIFIKHYHKKLTDREALNELSKRANLGKKKINVKIANLNNKKD